MISTTTFQRGDLLLLQFPYSGGGLSKLRPAMVVFDVGDSDLLVARVTTQLYKSSFDIAFADWKGAGLLAPSVVRLHKLATLEKASVRRKLGEIQAIDRAAVATALQQTFGKW
jgi:mRNA interferase MazF